MNFKKIVAVIATAAMALSAFAFPASAVDPLMVKFCAQDAEVGYAVFESQLELNGNGDYSVTITPDQAYKVWGKLTIEAVDTAAANIPDYAGAVLNIKSIVVNGDTELPLSAAASAFPLSHADAEGKIDTNFFNIWYEQQGGSPLDLSEGVAKFSTGSSAYAQFLGADGAAMKISSWTINFTLSGVAGDGAAAPAADAPAADAPATTAPATGNAPIAIVGSIAVAALIVTVVSRKRK
jgi:hypothetical protein